MNRVKIEYRFGMTTIPPLRIISRDDQQVSQSSPIPGEQKTLYLVAILVLTGEMDYNIEAQFTDLVPHNFRGKRGVPTGVFSNTDRMQSAVSTGVFCERQSPRMAAALPTAAWHQFKG